MDFYTSPQERTFHELRGLVTAGRQWPQTLPGTSVSLTQGPSAVCFCVLGRAVQMGAERWERVSAMSSTRKCNEDKKLRVFRAYTMRIPVLLPLNGQVSEAEKRLFK